MIKSTKVYNVFYRKILMGKVIDFDEGLIDFIRDTNPEIKVVETDQKSFIFSDVVKDIIESQVE